MKTHDSFCAYTKNGDGRPAVCLRNGKEDEKGKNKKRSAVLDIRQHYCQVNVGLFWNAVNVGQVPKKILFFSFSWPQHLTSIIFFTENKQKKKKCEKKVETVSNEQCKLPGQTGLTFVEIK